LKFYPNLVQAVVDGLQQVFHKNQLAKQVVPQLLRSNKKWGSRDRRFIASNIYDVVRWYRMYYEVLGHRPITERQWWQLLGIKWTIEGHTLPNWEEFEGLQTNDVLSRHQELIQKRVVRESIPDWLDDLGQAALGDQWEPTLHASNKEAAVTLRVNTLQTNAQQLTEALAQHQITLQETALPNALMVHPRRKITHLKAYKNGAFELQDLSSQLVAPFLQAEAGMTVIDACAGAGGKSLHLAALMQNQGEIIALDIDPNKLKELRKRKKRAQADIISTQHIKGQDTIQALHQKADRLLLDVPCSGLGTLRRNPQAKWRLNALFIEEIQKTQERILQNYTKMCKTGGYVVYATCSILPAENQEQVQHFLQSAAGQGFTHLKEKTILPQEEYGDGFYMALLRKDS